MVYTGKPSRACATCKKRRIKCDEARPACGQCVKSKRECTGYKTDAELMFRDETTATAKRAERSRKSKSTSPPKERDDSDNTDDYDVRVLEIEDGMILVPNASEEDDISLDIAGQVARYISFSNPPSATPNAALTLNRTVTPPYLDLAKAYFFDQFIMPRTVHDFNHLRLLDNMYRTAMPDDAISKATDALALLSLSRQPPQSFLRPDAAKAYGVAVHALGKAIADPVKIREDATLMSISLLSFAETLDISASQYSRPADHRFADSPKERGIAHFHQAWGAHAQGAQSIVRLRGVREMCSSSTSLPLLIQARFKMIIRNIFSCEPIEHFHEVWEPDAEGRALMNPFEPTIDLAGIGMRIPKLRFRALALCRRPMTSGMGDALNTLLDDLRDIEVELVNWSYKARNVRPQRVAGYYHGSSPTGYDLEYEKALPGHVFIYDNIAAMNAWNTYRTYRIFNQSMVFNILERLIPNNLHAIHPDLAACRKTITALAKDCCAAVPFGMGHLDNLPLSSTPPSSAYDDFAPSFVDPDLLPDQPYSLDAYPTFTSASFPGAPIPINPSASGLSLDDFDPTTVSFSDFEESFVEGVEEVEHLRTNNTSLPNGLSASFSAAAPSITHNTQTSYSRFNSPRSTAIREERRTHLSDDHGPAMSAWYLIWPLQVAQCAIPVPYYIKDFIRGRFRYVGKVYGIEQASIYTKRIYTEYIPGQVRTKVTPFDFAPPAWEPLQ